jgi:hypothetical protein
MNPIDPDGAITRSCGEDSIPMLHALLGHFLRPTFGGCSPKHYPNPGGDVNREARN